MALRQKHKSPGNSTIFYFVLLPRLLCLCLFIPPYGGGIVDYFTTLTDLPATLTMSTPLASTLMGVLVTPVGAPSEL